MPEPRTLERDRPAGAPTPGEVERTLAGLDALDRPLPARRVRATSLWASAWPKLVALAAFLALWQLLVVSGWRPPYALAGPGETFGDLAEDVASGRLLEAAATTLRRAALGFAASLALGTALGIAVASIRPLRTAIGSAISAVQTMPSIAWFPLAILLFGLTEQAIFFVVVLGAAPSIANGFVHGVDHIPPLLLRAGRSLGATGWRRIAYIVVPAAMPGYVGGLAQGWAFAWRSLMAGELLVIIANRPSLGVQLQLARELSDASGLLAAMVVVLVIGIAVDGLVFRPLETGVRRRRGLLAD
jgi:NitT/TauT family transport system permease protein